MQEVVIVPAGTRCFRCPANQAAPAPGSLLIGHRLGDASVSLMQVGNMEERSVIHAVCESCTNALPTDLGVCTASPTGICCSQHFSTRISSELFRTSLKSTAMDLFKRYVWGATFAVQLLEKNVAGTMRLEMLAETYLRYPQDGTFFNKRRCIQIALAATLIVAGIFSCCAMAGTACSIVIPTYYTFTFMTKGIIAMKQAEGIFALASAISRIILGICGMHFVIMGSWSLYESRSEIFHSTMSKNFHVNLIIPAGLVVKCRD